MKIKDFEITEKTVIKNCFRNETRLRKTLGRKNTCKRLGISVYDIKEMVKDGILEIVVFDSGYVCFTRESINIIEKEYQKILAAQRKYQKKLENKKS